MPPSVAGITGDPDYMKRSFVARMVGDHFASKRRDRPSRLRKRTTKSLLLAADLPVDRLRAEPPFAFAPPRLDAGFAALALLPLALRLHSLPWRWSGSG